MDSKAEGLQSSDLPPVRHQHVGKMHGMFPELWKVQRTSGVLSGILHPTQVEHDVPGMPGITSVWTARRHRKGRYPSLHRKPGEEADISHTRPVSLLAPFGYRLIGWEPGNISYWVAMAFIWGSIVWVVNGVFVFWPLSDEKLNLYLVGYTAVAGGSLFFVGSYLGVLEVLNAPTHVSLGHKIEHDMEEAKIKVLHHRHAGQGMSAGAGSIELRANRAVAGKLPRGQQATDQVAGEGWAGGVPQGSLHAGEKAEAEKNLMKWRWIGWEPRSFSFWTVSMQMAGATVFGVAACVTGVPHVLPMDYEEHWRIWDVLYWSPQVVGACFFILNSLMAMVEVQHSWLGVHPLDLGWEVAFWNLLGAVGFLLSGIFGYLEYPAQCCQHWGTAFSTFWGSIFFLISSYLLLPEALNK